MTEKVATQLEQVCNKGRTAKNLIPQGLIPDFGWNTDQQGPKRQPLPTEKQPEVAATQITPTQVEGPPSSRLRSKTSKNNLPHKQDQQDPPERNRTIPDLETVTTAMLQKFPGEKLPEPSTCEKIGNVFSLLSIARKAYSEVAHGLAELATLLTPQQYTLLLTATVTPSIQLIVPGQMISPLSTPPPPKQESITTTGRTDIMNFTKRKVLPNPESSSLTDCDDNSATCMLAAAVYCQLEKNYCCILIQESKTWHKVLRTLY